MPGQPGWNINGYDARKDPNSDFHKANGEYYWGEDGNGGFQWVEAAHMSPEQNKGLNAHGQSASGNPFSVPGGTEQLANYFGGMGNAFGFVPKYADNKTPGGQLDTGMADAERNRQSVLLGQLQQQAATGGGAWEGSLADATQKAASGASALGQRPGADYASALTNIGNAQGAVQQRAVGQGNILRAQSKQAATDQIAGLTAGMGEQDINQADAQAKAVQGQQQLNSALSGQANKNLVDTSSAAGQAIAMASKGGRVPGEAEVFGDDERNDVVPAMLSPEEIVIPRSHAGSPEAAADFVRALQRNQPQRMADGGEVSPIEKAHPSEFRDDAGLKMGSVGQDFGKSGQAPSIKNGGLLDPTQFNQTRKASNANEDQLAQYAAGVGPSVAPQQIQNSADQALAAGMRSKGPQASTLTAAALETQGDAGATAANEQRAGQAGLARASTQQRGAELGMSAAQQQAAWRNTQIAAGLGLQQQALLRGITSGAGQAGAAFASADAGRGNEYDFSSSDSNTGSLTSNDYAGRGSASDLSRDGEGGSDPSEWDLPAFSKGGKVKDTRAMDFVRALKGAR
jgi:hypothetical protein